MNFFKKLYNWWNFTKCQICLAEGKLVKTDMFGASIYKDCPYCKGKGYHDHSHSKYHIESVLLKQFAKGFKAINGEYYISKGDLFDITKVRKRK